MLIIRKDGYYRRRDGNVIGPMCTNALVGSDKYPWRWEDDVWTAHGVFDLDDPVPNVLDLVAEVHVDNGEHAIVAALRTNRGTQPTANGYYMCYVQRLSNPALVPVMLKRDNGRWFDTMYVPDPVVVTWCGPMPAVELGV